MRLEAGQPAEQLDQPARGAVGRLRPDAAAQQQGIAVAPGPPRARTGERRPHRDDHITERAQLGGHLVRGAGLEEDRREPDRRLGRADLLQHRELERALHWDDAAVVHQTDQAS